MKSVIIEHLFKQVEENHDLTAVRLLIADSIETLVEANRYSMTREAQAHFTNAVGSLVLNITSARQPTKVGLTTSIQDLNQALTALNDRGKRYDLRSNTELITCDVLLDAIKTMRETLQLVGAVTVQQTPSA